MSTPESNLTENAATLWLSRVNLQHWSAARVFVKSKRRRLERQRIDEMKHNFFELRQSQNKKIDVGHSEVYKKHAQVFTHLFNVVQPRFVSFLTCRLLTWWKSRRKKWRWKKSDNTVQSYTSWDERMGKREKTQIGIFFLISCPTRKEVYWRNCL